MIKTMGNTVLLAFSEKQHASEVLIAGLAVNYATSEGKYIKLNVNFTH